MAILRSALPRLYVDIRLSWQTLRTRANRKILLRSLSSFEEFAVLQFRLLDLDRGSVALCHIVVTDGNRPDHAHILTPFYTPFGIIFNPATGDGR